MTPFVTSPLRTSDVAELARIHRQSFPGFFLSSLGEPFLREFYKGFLGDPDGIAVVLRDEADGRPLGAAVGPLHPEGFFRRLLRRRLIAFAWASVGATIRSPHTLPRLLRAAKYRGQAGPSAPGALLSSICVSPQLKDRGAGSQLLRAWEVAVASNGISSAHLTTDAIDNERVNAFYERRGWLRVDTLTTAEGRVMLLRARSDFGASPTPTSDSAAGITDGEEKQEDVCGSR